MSVVQLKSMQHKKAFMGHTKNIYNAGGRQKALSNPGDFRCCQQNHARCTPFDITDNLPRREKASRSILVLGRSVLRHRPVLPQFPLQFLVAEIQSFVLMWAR